MVTILAGCSSKKGCIDPGSISYDPDAKIDDGSCTYPSFSLTLTPSRILDNYFSETSGLKFKDNRVWTVIDEAGENKFYSIDLLNGGIKETVQALGISSIDFEAITSSSTHFFVGDFGNNEGNRTDLTVYKIPKPSSYLAVNTASFEKITFKYPEQTDFRVNPDTHYDAEALLFYNDKLFILTKSHDDNTTTLYEIPSHAGDYEAKIRGVFDVKGLVTDADISPDGSQLAMLCYNKENRKIFFWLITGFTGSSFFTGKKKLVELGTIDKIGQMEGITFASENSLFLSNEQYETVAPNLYFVTISTVQ